MNIEEIEEVREKKNIPDILLVKRLYPEKTKKNRIFKLKRLEKDGMVVEKKNKTKKHEEDDKDYEEFLDELEENKHMREKINLYKDEGNIKKLDEKEFRRRKE